MQQAVHLAGRRGWEKQVKHEEGGRKERGSGRWGIVDKTIERGPTTPGVAFWDRVVYDSEKYIHTVSTSNHILKLMATIFKHSMTRRHLHVVELDTLSQSTKRVRAWARKTIVAK